jgi:hypothetical protein
MPPARPTLQTFTEHDLPDLDVVVRGALELFAETNLPTLPAAARPLVIGSAGALATGRLLYRDVPAVFADESSYEPLLAAADQFDAIVLISASGGKHAGGIAERLAALSTPVYLVTTNPAAPAAATLPPAQVIVTPKNREPYTYNTSTYLGMVLARTGESASDILTHLTAAVHSALPENLADYDAFTFILPPAAGGVCPLVQIKFEELFMPKVIGRAYTSEEIKHAKTMVSSDTELFISLGEPNTAFGAPAHRLTVPLPPAAGLAATMATAYYVVGRIQAAHPPYFKESVSDYVAHISDVFGQQLSVIVE